MHDDWNEHDKSINKAVFQKAEEAGITRELMFEFDEFDIKDTYLLNGTFCYFCSRNLKCPRHPYAR